MSGPRNLGVVDNAQARVRDAPAMSCAEGVQFDLLRTKGLSRHWSQPTATVRACSSRSLSSLHSPPAAVGCADGARYGSTLRWSNLATNALPGLDCIAQTRIAPTRTLDP